MVLLFSDPVNPSQIYLSVTTVSLLAFLDQCRNLSILANVKLSTIYADQATMNRFISNLHKYLSSRSLRVKAEAYLSLTLICY